MDSLTKKTANDRLICRTISPLPDSLLAGQSRFQAHVDAFWALQHSSIGHPPSFKSVRRESAHADTDFAGIARNLFRLFLGCVHIRNSITALECSSESMTSLACSDHTSEGPDCQFALRNAREGTQGIICPGMIPAPKTKTIAA